MPKNANIHGRSAVIRGIPVKGATKGLGLDVYTAAQKPEGEITEVSYLSLKPGDDPNGWAPKVSFVTRGGDLGCGVGYYK